MTGIFNGPLDKLADLIAGTTTFQTWVGHTGSAASAKAHIYFYDLPSGSLTLPFALLDIGPDYRTFAIAGGAGQVYNMDSELIMHLEGAAGTGTDSAKLVAFMETIGALIAELKDDAGVSTALQVKEFQKTLGPLLSDPKDTGTESIMIQFLVKI